MDRRRVVVTSTDAGVAMLARCVNGNDALETGESEDNAGEFTDTYTYKTVFDGLEMGITPLPGQSQ